MYNFSLANLLQIIFSMMNTISFPESKHWCMLTEHSGRALVGNEEFFQFSSPQGSRYRVSSRRGGGQSCGLPNVLVALGLRGTTKG